MNDEKLLTVPELAAQLQISEGKIRALYREKKIPIVRVSYRNVRFDYQDVIQALKASSDPRVQEVRERQAELNLA
jgi:excisionase family DNA binding protein